jgi:hypothetical protein
MGYTQSLVQLQIRDNDVYEAIDTEAASEANDSSGQNLQNEVVSLRRQVLGVTRTAMYHKKAARYHKKAARYHKKAAKKETDEAHKLRAEVAELKKQLTEAAASKARDVAEVEQRLIAAQESRDKALAAQDAMSRYASLLQACAHLQQPSVPASKHGSWTVGSTAESDMCDRTSCTSACGVGCVGSLLAVPAKLQWADVTVSQSLLLSAICCQSSLQQAGSVPQAQPFRSSLK